jgi:hypothetical protein
MVRAGRKTKVVFVLSLSCCTVTRIHSQDSFASPLDTSGQTVIDGRSQPYLVRHLPVNAFPQLPLAVQSQLNRRGCLIPQTYEAHRPENVVHASFEQHGSSDWAVLCSVSGTVSLLVFLSSSSDPTVLATAPEISRLQAYGSSNILGFNWGIDPASPEQIHEAQLNMRHPPPRVDHDALADSVVEGPTLYRYYSRNTWTILDTQD